MLWMRSCDWLPMARAMMASPKAVQVTTAGSRIQLRCSTGSTIAGLPMTIATTTHIYPKLPKKPERMANGRTPIW
ncbi:hypothetical protein GCM10027030_30180 [Luteococcus sediminum]